RFRVWAARTARSGSQTRSELKVSRMAEGRNAATVKSGMRSLSRYYRNARVLFPPGAADPGVIGIVRRRHGARAAGEHVEIVDVVAVRRDHGMIALRDQDQFAVPNRERLIQPPVVRVDALDRISLGPIDLVIVNLFEIH